MGLSELVKIENKLLTHPRKIDLEQRGFQKPEENVILVTINSDLRLVFNVFFCV